MENFEEFIRWFLPFYIVSLFLIAYVFTVFSFKRKYGKDPRVTIKEDSIMYLLELYRSILFMITVFVIVIYSFTPYYYKYLLPLHYLENIYFKAIGLLLMIWGLILVRVAQIQLKSSYRHGIDSSDTKTELITSGVYRWSRNPITFGMFIISIGTFLIIPNIITFAVANLTFLIISVRSRKEEEHLLKLHGDKYLRYKKETRRWI